MKIETIFRNITDFQSIILDKILFENSYPVMFTCKNKEDVYLFICCLVTADIVKWIGTKTTYDNLIELLENKITIRDAFLNVTEDKMVINYNGKKVEYSVENGRSLPEKILPAAGEYMDAEEDEYIEEIAEFKRRNSNREFIMKPQIHRFFIYRYRGKALGDQKIIFR